MKQLTCEMCGSTDLIKDGGVFVCQSCGTKYSIEEAKKMMVEGTVEIVGTVRIDNSSSYDKFIDLARDAFEDSRYEGAYDYCSKALDVNTENSEMILLQGLSLLGKEEFGKNIPVGCTNAVKTYLEKMSSFEWGAETAQEFATAMQYVNSVCNYKISELDAKIAEIRVDLRPTRGALDILADLGRPAFVVSQNQAEDKKIELHNKQVQGKIDAVQAKVNTIVGFQKEAIEQMSALSKTKSEEAAKKRFDEYWAAHAEEKAKLDKEQANLKTKMDELNAKIAAIDKKSAAKCDELRKERDKKLPCEVEVDKQRDLIRDLEAQRAKCGIFKGKEKKAIQARLDTEENPKLESLQKKADAEKKAHQDKFNAEINVVKSEGKELRDEVANLKKRSDEITKELTKDR